MNIVSIISSAIGYNLIPLVFFVIAILVAKKSSTAAWILFAIGAAVGAIALFGSIREYFSLQSYFTAAQKELLVPRLTANGILFAINVIASICFINARKK